MGKGKGKVQRGKTQDKERTGIWCTVIKVQLFISACVELERKGNNKTYMQTIDTQGDACLLCLLNVIAQHT